MLELESELSAFSDSKDLIAINSGEVPTPMYFAHRKGWVETNQNLLNEQYISELKMKGLRFIVVLKNGFGTETSLPYPIQLENKHYLIYSLN